MPSMQWKSFSLLATCIALAACNSDSDSSSDNANNGQPLVLNIVHINDHHSNLEPLELTLQLDGQPTTVEVGGFPRITRLFNEAEAEHANLLKLHAGDAVTGTLYYTFYEGQADADLMNTVCFDAFALGNHEFDDGDAQLKAFLDHLADGSCNTPALAANVKPAVGTPLAPSAVDDYIKAHVVTEVDGVQVGIVGIDIAGKTQNSSRPLPTTVFEDEVTAAQRSIDELQEQGVEHIVLLTHQGYQNDVDMAARLSGVDVIIGGDSHTLVGDFRNLGLQGPDDTPLAYPTVVTNRDGEMVCIGQAWEYTKVFGLMTVNFNAEGAVESCGGQASLVIGDEFQRDDAPLNETETAALLQVLAEMPEVAVAQPDPDAQSILDRYQDQLDAARREQIGSAEVPFCLVRVPGTTRSGGVPGCEMADQLAQGSDAAQLVAGAFLEASKRADFSLQNAGGVRTPMAAGVITFDTAATMLPFTNVLVELDITGAETVAALEDAVWSHVENGGGDGSHPYAAALRWDLDMSQPRGSRFSNVEVKGADDLWAPINPTQTYVMVTNDFLGEGRDGYLTLGEVTADGRSINTGLLYTQSLVDYLKARPSVGTIPRDEYSHQRVITVSGTELTY